MKKLLILTVTLPLLATSPAWAQQETWQDKINRHMRNDNVTRAVGALGGALLGTQIGSGSGKILAIAAGTLGGYWLGGKLSQHLRESDQRGIAMTTERAIDTGKTTTWSNPDTGMTTTVSSRKALPGHAQGGTNLRTLKHLPPMELVNRYYEPSVNINVRGGPGTEYSVLRTLRKDTPVVVVGRVVDSNWFAISENSMVTGFVYAPLMHVSEEPYDTGNAIRTAMANDDSIDYVELDTRECRIVTQKVTLANGENDTHEFKACRQSDGTWAEV